MNDFHLGNKDSVVRAYHERGYVDGRIERAKDAVVMLGAIGDSVTDWTQGNPAVLIGRDDR